MQETKKNQSVSSQLAKWHAQEMKFRYVGYNTYYTCNAIEDKLKVLLLEFGAAPDIYVRASGCFGVNQVERHISVKLRFSVPVLL